MVRLPGTSQRKQWLLRSQNWLYVILLLVLAGLAAWLSQMYVYQSDWTAGNRNSLSAPSVSLLAVLDEPVRITAFAREEPALRAAIRDFVARYQRVEPSVSLEFINPDTNPARVRELSITAPGTLIVHLGDAFEKVTRLNEQTMTNALARLQRQGDSVISFLTGHGERAPEGRANFDLGSFSQELQQLGIDTRSVNLAKNPDGLDEVALLVIAGPEVALLSGEVQLIQQYLDNGGNLLWLAEPGAERYGLEPLLEDLGVQVLPGVVVDPTTRLFGIQDPAYTLVVDYPSHNLTRGMQALTLYPEAAALTFGEDSAWEISAILTTLARAWTETDELTGTIRFDADTEERAGPLDIGLALSRQVDANGPEASSSAEPSAETIDNVTQRVVIIGDGDFLSNAFLGNGANLELGVRVVNWLLGDDDFIEIGPVTPPDQGLVLSRLESAVIALGSMVVLPVLLMLTGIFIWWWRRRR